MKTVDSLKPDTVDSEQPPHQAVKSATPALIWKDDQKASESESLEIFYDGREVYGGY